MKTCSRCGETKLLTDFHKRKASPDGLAYHCVPCARQLATESNRRRGKQPMNAPLESIRKCRSCEKVTDRFEGRRRVCMDCRKAQRDPMRAAEYAKSADRRAKVYERNARRRARMANAGLAEEFPYYEAQTIKSVYGGLPHVDHIIPLNGTKASGLHVAANLQLLPAEQNLLKGRNHG